MVRVLLALCIAASHAWAPESRLVDRSKYASSNYATGDGKRLISDAPSSSSLVAATAPLVIGAAAAVMGAAYAAALRLALRFWQRAPAPWAIPCATAGGGAVVGALARRAPAFGVAGYIAAARGSRPFPEARTHLAPFLLTSLATTAFGFSVGPEAPMVVAGAMLGAAMGRRVGGRERDAALAGAAGALTSFIDMPVAGAIFVVGALLVRGVRRDAARRAAPRPVCRDDGTERRRTVQESRKSAAIAASGARFRGTAGERARGRWGLGGFAVWWTLDPRGSAFVISIRCARRGHGSRSASGGRPGENSRGGATISRTRNEKVRATPGSGKRSSPPPRRARSGIRATPRGSRCRIRPTDRPRPAPRLREKRCARGRGGARQWADSAMQPCGGASTNSRTRSQPEACRDGASRWCDGSLVSCRTSTTRECPPGAETLRPKTRTAVVLRSLATGWLSSKA